MAVRPDRLRVVRLRSLDGLTHEAVRGLLDEPASAISALTREYTFFWDFHRSDDVDLRITGGLELVSGAYVQWIGYREVVVVECSSNVFLATDAQLTTEEEGRLVRCGFASPDDDEPNFWLEVARREAAGAAAMAVVAVLTTVDGVYAG